MDEREATLKQISAKAIQETEKLAGTQRFALFSSPIPLALGDNSYDNKPRHPRNEQGKPATEPPNCKVKCTAKGKVASSYFQVPKLISVGDPYIDAERRIRLEHMQEKKLYQSEDRKRFIPPSGHKEEFRALYEHKPDYDLPNGPPNHKDANGRVIVAPKNCVTNPACKLLHKFPDHQVDEYGRYREAQKQAMLLDHKLIGEKAPFKSTVFTTENFQRDKDAFGMAGTMPEPKKPKELDLKSMKHDAPFKPSHPTKSGVKGLIGPLPPYKGDPLVPVTRKDFVKGKDNFKPNNLGNLSRPTPSISCFPHNLKRELNSRVF